MRLQIDEIPSIEETEIIIRCNKIDSKINRISNYIRTSYITINGNIIQALKCNLSSIC